MADLTSPRGGHGVLPIERTARCACGAMRAVDERSFEARPGAISAPIAANREGRR